MASKLYPYGQLPRMYQTVLNLLNQLFKVLPRTSKFKRPLLGLNAKKVGDWHSGDVAFKFCCTNAVDARTWGAIATHIRPTYSSRGWQVSA